MIFQHASSILIVSELMVMSSCDTLILSQLQRELA